MTLRDWFAGQALQGLINGDKIKGKSYDEVCTVAYKFADTMMRERESNEH